MVYLKTVELQNPASQTECLEEMFAAVADKLDAGQMDELKEAVYTREDTASTFLGDELAAPHGRISGLGDEIVVLGVSKNGVDWPTQEQRAKFVVLIGVDRKRISAYLALLQKIIKWYRSSDSHPSPESGAAELAESLERHLA